uniref:DUF1499 domain-containing protein n=1 Tax=Rhodopseudomonas palustris (strain BisA53) TaxID=316055 RepID=Q07IF6_RHOP5
MARRFSATYHTEPMSRLALWARRLAVFSAIATLASLGIVRFGFLEMKPAMATFFAALGLAGLSIVVALAGFVAIWQTGARGMGAILVALLLDAVLLAYPGYLAVQWQKLPHVHDITTDSIDPPKFETLARLRVGDGTNTAVYAGLYSAEQQRQTWPDIETVQLDVPAPRAYDIALQLVTKRKWTIIDARTPQPPKMEGKIEAVARTPIMGFREDVAIRVRPDGSDASQVDIRSSSRYFESDFGSNAARITRLIVDINAAAEVTPAAKKPAAPAKDAAKGKK